MKLVGKTVKKVLVIGTALVIGSVIGSYTANKKLEPEMIEITRVVSEDEENENI